MFQTFLKRFANGSGEPAPVPSTITHEDNVLSGFSGKLPYNVKSSSPNGQAMVTDATTLDNYNNGLLTSVAGDKLTILSVRGVVE